MKTYNHTYTNSKNLKLFIQSHHLCYVNNLLVQVFTSLNNKHYIQNMIGEILSIVPHVKIIGTTTSGEIANENAQENTTLLSFSYFEKTSIETYITENYTDSFQTGINLINNIDNPLNNNIKAAICFSDGINTNGEDLINGISSVNEKIIIAGGMAGDYSKYKETFVFTQDGIINNGAVLATLNNPNLNINTNFSFNWDYLGVEHTITKSEKNRVYTIDDKTALEFYKYYLGDQVEDHLLEIGIEFPLVFNGNGIKTGRAIVKKYDDGSLCFSGHIDQDTKVKFGHGNLKTIVNESSKIVNDLTNKPVETIFIYSSVARKTLLQNNIDIEITPFSQIGAVSGFFTNGEFFHNSNNEIKTTKLLNQSLTILAISESEDIKQNDLQKCDMSPNEDINVQRIEALSHLISRTTKQLEDITSNLEKKVENEVEKNLEKDKIVDMIQAQAEVGSMMEMIVHQWRQPLNGISTAASGIQINNEYGILTDESLNNLTSTILDLVKHTHETIDDFRQLFKEKQVYETINSKKLIEKTKLILKSMLANHSIVVKEEYICKDSQDLYLPIGQFMQVLLVIIKNAIDAIVENEIIDPIIKISVEKDNGNSIFKIEDNAGGIPEEIITEIFKRRFSTKHDTHGTGIGLDICKTIVEKTLHGEIKAYNSNNGAVFEIVIPNI